MHSLLYIHYTHYTHIKLLVDQADALSFKEGEEVTFLRWGNFFIDKIVKNESGDKVISMEVSVVYCVCMSEVLYICSIVNEY